MLEVLPEALWYVGCLSHCGPIPKSAKARWAVSTVRRASSSTRWALSGETTSCGAPTDGWPSRRNHGMRRYGVPPPDDALFGRVVTILEQALTNVDLTLTPPHSGNRDAAGMMDNHSRPAASGNLDLDRGSRSKLTPYQKSSHLHSVQPNLNLEQSKSRYRFVR